MKVIKKGLVIKAIEDLQDCYNGFSGTYDKACIIGVIDEIPVVDAVEVVRCADCKWREGRFCIALNMGGIECDDFCSFGKRRTE